MTKVSNVSGGATHDRVVIEEISPKSPLVTEDPNKIEYAVDSLNRRIGARKLSAIDMFELTLIMGEHSGNSAALNQAMMAASVVSIDDLTVRRPVSFGELRARITLLNFAGYLAAAEAVGKFAESAEPNVDAIKN